MEPKDITPQVPSEPWKPLTIPRMEKDALRAFVRDYLAGLIFTSANIRDFDMGLLSMIFMPIALGALAFGEPQPKEPEAPKTPVQGGLPTEPVDPGPVPTMDESKYLKKALDRLHELEFKFSWDEVPESVVVRQREKIENARQKLSGKYRVLAQAHIDKQTAYMAEKAVYDAKCREVAEKYLTDMVQYEQDLQAFNSGKTKADYDAAMVEWSTRDEEYSKFLQRTLGVIWTYNSGAGPRAVNGYPIFSDMRLMHKDDWDIARKTIIREQNKAQDMTLEGDDP